MAETSSAKIIKENIGKLAINILSSRKDLSKMRYQSILRELSKIICDLQTEIDDMHL